MKVYIGPKGLAPQRIGWEIQKGQDRRSFVRIQGLPPYLNLHDLQVHEGQA